jgi:alpha-tubulin suppressor-like RCC1 family protein
MLGLGASSSGNVLTPQKITNFTNITHIAAGENVSYAIKSAGTVFGWGNNSSGLVGNGTSGSDVTTPVALSLPSGLTPLGIAGGYGARVNVKAANNDKIAYSWGDNHSGQLCDGSYLASNSPLSVLDSMSPTEVVQTDILSIDFDNTVTIMLLSDGKLKSCGGNNYGQSGTGTGSSTAEFVQDGSGNTFILP